MEAAAAPPLGAPIPLVEADLVSARVVLTPLRAGRAILGASMPEVRHGAEGATR